MVCRLRRAANVDNELGNVEGPILGGNLGVGFDAVLVCLVYGIGVVPTGLDGVVLGREEMLGNLRYKLIIVAAIEAGLVCGDDGIVLFNDFWRRRRRKYVLVRSV